MLKQLAETILKFSYEEMVEFCNSKALIAHMTDIDERATALISWAKQEVKKDNLNSKSMVSGISQQVLK